MEAVKAPIVTVSQLRQVKAFLLNIRALIVGIVWAGVADIRTPPLRYPQCQTCAPSCRNGSTHKARRMSQCSSKKRKKSNPLHHGQDRIN